MYNYVIEMMLYDGARCRHEYHALKLNATMRVRTDIDTFWHRRLEEKFY